MITSLLHFLSNNYCIILHQYCIVTHFGQHGMAWTRAINLVGKLLEAVAGVKWCLCTTLASFLGSTELFWGKISERGAVGILGTGCLSRQKWPNCPHCPPIVFGWLTATGRWDPCGFTFSCPIEYFGCSCSYTLQQVQLLSRIAFWLSYYDHFLCQIRFLFTSSFSLALSLSIKLILHRCTSIHFRGVWIAATKLHPS